MKQTIRPDGRHHSMPKGVYGFFRDLESFAGVESVDSERFIPRNNVKEFEANIQFYDASRRTFRVKVGNKGFLSYFGIRVSIDARNKVEEYIRNYCVNRVSPRNLQEDYCGLNQPEAVGV